jgi:hypothetical protein
MSQLMDLCHLIAIGEQEENLLESQLVHIFWYIFNIFPFVSHFDIVFEISSSVLDHC